jgi:3-oxoacyl-[acyl-carrier protein] reductase
MTDSLTGKAAIVAGGSRGIGAAIVRRLAREGASVAFTYSSAQAQSAALVAEIEAAGGRILAIRADSADPAAIRAAVDRAWDAFGRLDILVNNAGIMLRGAEQDDDLVAFDRMLAVNVRAYFVFAQAAARRMTAGGRIIAIGSVVAESIRFPGGSFYAMTKSAVAGLTRGLARDLGPRGITVNTVQPGPTATDMTPGEGPIADAMAPLIALGRLARDEEIASFVAYLAGPESSFITGAALTIDGGYLA